MALERQSIEKKDFPIGRRGYDPEAVDAHLARLADEVEELKKSARRRSETLASSASDQVRAIIEAAEASAAAIQAQAEEEAAEIRAEARAEAQHARDQTTGEAREYVGRVSESTTVMIGRLDAMENEISALFESLRTGGNRLSADLKLLEGNFAELGQAAAPRQRFEAEDAPARPARPAAPAPVPSPRPIAEIEPEPEADPAPAERESEPVPAEAPQAADADLGDGGVAAGDDTEGARLIALNMALNGTSREETGRYLAENFSLSDRDGLLDEVYASVSG